jgi:hypothetical protein
MTSRTRRLLFTLTGVLAALPALSCGPDWPTAVFVNPNGPDGRYTTFAAGHLGVLQPGYRTRNLVVAYDWLTHRELTPAEQKQATAVDDLFSDENSDDSKSSAAGFQSWIDARNTAGFPLDVTTMPDSTHAVPGDQYERFSNCLDNAYANAASTLRARVASYGAKNSEVSEWVRGQDAVFSNCPGTGSVPEPITSGSLWLRQDRAYQIAAAQFYSMDYASALAGFRAIAADHASPWSMLARYLEARALIRQATVPGDSGTRDSSPAATVPFNTGLTQARTDLLAMRAEARMTPMRGAIDDLLDYINLRLQPEQQAVVLASRLHSPHPHNFGQSLIDLSWIRANDYDDNDLPLYDTAHRTPQVRAAIRATAHASAEREGADMLDWMDSVHEPALTDSSLKHWRSTRTTPWLIAAMMSTQPGDASAAELIAAAKNIPATDPAYVAVTYQRLRLSPPNAATRADLLAVLPTIEKSADISTSNLFLSLNAATAPTLDAWLTAAPRDIAAEPDEFDESGDVGDEPNPCGDGKIPADQRRLFDADIAVALNTDFPLRLLADAAASPALPQNLRFQVTQATWARAVVLDRPEIAQRMTPLLIHCRAAWTPVLNAYDHATNVDDRHIAGLLALMRFASTEPSVREGEARRNGFATYDEYRQNWWCSTVPAPGNSVDEPLGELRATPPSEPAPPPSFLTATDLSEAKTEVASLRKIPNAAAYFQAEALSWVHAHPHDPHDADLLGEAMRVERNSCGDEATSALAHQVFDALQHDYPHSEWAKRYPTWE